eukprot:974654-Amphidinium_carterae.1
MAAVMSYDIQPRKERNERLLLCTHSAHGGGQAAAQGGVLGAKTATPASLRYRNLKTGKEC